MIASLFAYSARISASQGTLCLVGFRVPATDLILDITTSGPIRLTTYEQQIGPNEFTFPVGANNALTGFEVIGTVVTKNTPASVTVTVGNSTKTLNFTVTP